MAIGKWSMYVCALLFLVIGLGSLAVAVVPGANEWFAEEILDASGAPSSAFDDEVVDAIADSEGVRTTAWILAGTFLPTALLFAWCGRWFKSMQPRVASMFGLSTPTVQDGIAAYQQFAQGAGMAGTGTAAGPAKGPVVEPADPTAGGIIG